MFSNTSRRLPSSHYSISIFHLNDIPRSDIQIIKQIVCTDTTNHQRCDMRESATERYGVNERMGKTDGRMSEWNKIVFEWRIMASITITANEAYNWDRSDWIVRIRVIVFTVVCVSVYVRCMCVCVFDSNEKSNSQKKIMPKHFNNTDHTTMISVTHTKHELKSR